jgi:hypothetical protein
MLNTVLIRSGVFRIASNVKKRASWVRPNLTNQRARNLFALIVKRHRHYEVRGDRRRANVLRFLDRLRDRAAW